MPTLRVLDPGLHATVQDLGRRGRAHEGVPESGAADGLSLRLGNRLISNQDDAAAIEWTVRGGTVEFDAASLIVLAGAPMDARAEPLAEGSEGGAAGAMDMPMWTPAAVTRGTRLTLGPARAGARTYLCIRGGVDAPVVLGARATHASAGFGGHGGRALRAGDALPIGPAGVHSPHGARPLAADARAFIESVLARRTLRVVRGPHAGLFDAPAWASFTGGPFTVSARSDRMGVRLDPTGPLAGGDRASGRTIDPHHQGAPVTDGGARPLDRSRGRPLPRTGGRLPSEGAPWGAVQVTEGGQLIALGPDHPTTGGYPVIATVIGADLPALGQLAPGERVRFEAIGVDAARTIRAGQERTLDGLVPGAGRPAGSEGP